MHLAAKLGQVQALRALLEAGADKNGLCEVCDVTRATASLSSAHTWHAACAAPYACAISLLVNSVPSSWAFATLANVHYDYCGVRRACCRQSSWQLPQVSWRPWTCCWRRVWTWRRQR